MEYNGILEAENIELHGRHMIEASAGTGKTHNITRIYVRLLVEKNLSVRQILVMTFTEAATEEIKQRIGLFLTQLINEFDEAPCEFSKLLQSRVGKTETLNILRVAKLELDLAAIYTIHGFCQRAIGRYGLSMDIPQDATLQADFSKIKLSYVADTIRSLRATPEKLLLLQDKNWHDPQVFVNTFYQLLGNNKLGKPKSKKDIILERAQKFNDFWQENKQSRHLLIQLLQNNNELLMTGLKTAKPAQINQEVSDAIAWLSQNELIDPKHFESFILSWLGVNNTNKEEIKKADNCVLNGSFSKLFSAPRLKNYQANNDGSAKQLINAAIEFIKSINSIGIKAPSKNALKNVLGKADAYQLVATVINSVNKKISLHKKTHGVIGFDDLIETVAKTLERAAKDSTNADESGLIANLRSEYPAALVDEFQDTDQFQYSILDTLYPTASQSQLLLMIGDPKQAIYSFRGGDIFTYIKARDCADYIWGMNINYRSSSQIINSYNRFFHGNALMQENRDLFGFTITYPLIKAPEKDHKAMSIIDANEQFSKAAFSFVFANNVRVTEELESGKSSSKDTPTSAQEYEILNWCALETKRLIADVYIAEDDKQTNVASDDIAILVRSANQAKKVKSVFSSHNLSTVFLSERSSLFSSSQALHILWLLQGVHHSSRENTRRALTTGLIDIGNEGHSESELLLDDGHSAWQNVYSSMLQYQTIWLSKGVFAMLQAAISNVDIHSKSAERILTNYLHIAELLAEASVSCKTPLQLIYWLHQQITDPQQQEASELRLESDNKVIKIITQHKAKGLEYPIVFLPFANGGNDKTESNVAIYHNKNYDLVAELGVTEETKQTIKDEAIAEDMRLLYVSLTRPVLRCYLGMVALTRRNNTALMRALNVSISTANASSNNIGESFSEQVQTQLADICDDLSFSMADNMPIILNKPPTEGVLASEALSFTQFINTRWQVTSFSRLSKQLVQRTGLAQSELAETDSLGIEYSREADESDLTPETSLPGPSTHSLIPATTEIDYRFAFPKGPDAGNFLHDLLENIDFNTTALSDNIKQVLKDMAITKINQQLIDVDGVINWVEQMLNASLSSSLGLTLSSLQTSQVLKESEFYFPLKHVDVKQLLVLVNGHRKELAKHFAINIETLVGLNSLDAQSAAQSSLQKSIKRAIQGAMHGFIDLIFEFDDAYYVADYKSNYLSENPLDYESSNLCRDIVAHQYDIQYLIYCVALHRYLKVQIPNYDYELHFGGVYYLYLRGLGLVIDNGQNVQGDLFASLSGPSSEPSLAQTPALGVYSYKVDYSLILALDELFSEKSSKVLSEDKESLL